jgi:hypothetical protein
MKKVKLKEISQNNLEELVALCNELNSDIHRYSHVAEHLPVQITVDIAILQNKLVKELNRREDEE